MSNGMMFLIVLCASMAALLVIAYLWERDSWMKPPRKGAAVVALLLSLASTAQSDGPPLIGWHDLPPPMNFVLAGDHLVADARLERAAWLVAIGGGIAAWWVHKENEPLAIGIGMFTLGATLTLRWTGSRHREKAGTMLVLGYDPAALYEVAPDSISNAAPKLVPR